MTVKLFLKRSSHSLQVAFLSNVFTARLNLLLTCLYNFLSLSFALTVSTLLLPDASPFSAQQLFGKVSTLPNWLLNLMKSVWHGNWQVEKHLQNFCAALIAHEAYSCLHWPPRPHIELAHVFERVSHCRWKCWKQRRRPRFPQACGFSMDLHSPSTCCVFNLICKWKCAVIVCSTHCALGPGSGCGSRLGQESLTILISVMPGHSLSKCF